MNFPLLLIFFKWVLPPPPPTHTQMHYYFAKNLQTLWLIVKKNALPLIFLNYWTFLHKYVILQNIFEIRDFLFQRGNFFNQCVKFSVKFKLEMLISRFALWNGKLAHAWKREINVLESKGQNNTFVAACSTFFSFGEGW